MRIILICNLKLKGYTRTEVLPHHLASGTTLFG